ncbi:hypothetical protein [Nocardia sp. CS682]|uniref:hypothetical protein n=1 Tax=Nocardia sp. CS682 TaxID=1047172 RepID=UPI001074B67D|nr:hypothetical protein [Nocardia sp. CS682]
MSMMIAKSVAAELVYGSVESWEYGCCGEVPAEGGSLRAGVTALPDEAGGRFLAPPILDWDRDLELVRFTNFSARWDPKYGEPRGLPLRLGVSWHNQGSVVPAIVADIVTVYQESMLYQLSGPALIPMRGTMEYTRMTAVERFPDTGAFEQEQAVGAPVRNICGALMGIRLRSCEEPSAEVLTAYRDGLERASRTVDLIGPPTIFGPVVPGRGDRLTVDLSDSRLTLLGKRTELSGVVHGQAGQVSIVNNPGQGWIDLGDITPGTPTDTIDAPLYVTLTIDPSRRPDLRGN